MSDGSPASETTRIEAFSDGVFAIAITLLILDIRVPRPDSATSAALVQRLLGLWPHLLAYLLSFAVILVLWVEHHKVFRLIRHVDQTFLYLNGLVLMVVTFIPFPTALLSEYTSHYMAHGSAAEFRTAVAVYSGHGVLIALAFQAMWRYATREGRLLAHNYDRAMIEKIHQQYRWSPVAYLLVFGMAFVLPWVSLGLSLGLVLFFCFEGIFRAQRARAALRSHRSNNPTA